MKVSFYLSASGKSPVEKYIESLSKADQARFLELYRGILKYGTDSPRAVFKPLKGKLWEIKFKAEGGGYRILYVLVEKEHMVWLHAFKKKTQKTPRKELSVAEKRMKDVL